MPAIHRKTAVAAAEDAHGADRHLVAGLHARPVFRLLRPTLWPLLAVPHLATAVGLAFLLAPSGWPARLLALPLGWDRPPDLATVNDPAGLALTLGLLFRVLAPMRSRERMRQVAEGVEAMNPEEAAYWLGMRPVFFSNSSTNCLLAGLLKL